MSCARRKTMKRFSLSSPLPRVSSAWERGRVRENHFSKQRVRARELKVVFAKETDR